MKRIISVFLSVILLMTTIFSTSISSQAASTSAKPKATTITSITAKSKGFTVKWKKQNVTGYQIKYSTSSKFKNVKTVTITNKNTSSKTISKLKAKKKYYVRIRTYKSSKGTKTYSSWSKTKSVTTKGNSNTNSHKSDMVYVTPTGQRYHYDPECGGKNSAPRSLEYAKSIGLTPCKKCVH